MAFIDQAEIKPGLVIHMNYQLLTSHPDVQQTSERIFRVGDEVKSRTLVCIAVVGDRSWWTPTSTTSHSSLYSRMPLEPAWRSGGDPQWTSADQFLLDGADILEGPSSCFVQASHSERTTPANRARLSEAGLKSIAKEIQKQHHRRTSAAQMNVPEIDA